MKKCDFCTKSDSNSNCTFNIFTISAYSKEYYCEKAIDEMKDCIEKAAKEMKKYIKYESK